MREILFRGKRTNNGEWVYGDLIQNVDCLKIREQEKSIKKIAKSYEVDRDTVGQFTGLCDKNGKKIFEGDIHKYLDYVFVIEFGEFIEMRTDYSLVGWHMRRAKTIACVSFDGTENEYANIIGNIYDNPELLEG